MRINGARRISFCITAILILFVLVLRFCTSSSHIRIARAFTTEDITAIRGAVSRESWSEARKAIAAYDFKRAWNYALPVLLSRTESIAGFPGPPGGARVDCRGAIFDNQCSFMLFK